MLVRNKKNRKIYFAFNKYAIDATNEREGDFCVFYFRNPFGKWFVRESREFLVKFDKII